MAGFHHVELWVADLDEAKGSWGWLLERLGFVLKNEWPQGQSWAAGGAYLTITTSPNLSKREHDRRRPGMNHMATIMLTRSEEHTSELQSRGHLVCRLLLEKKKEYRCRLRYR